MVTVMDAFRAYFWLLVAGVIVGGAWAANEYLVKTGTIDRRWLAVAAFAALLAVFFYAFRRFSS